MTVIFSDGFETGDLTKWSGSTVTATCSVTGSDQTNPHHGVYNLKAYIAKNLGVGSCANVNYNVANMYQHLFVRAMNVRFDVLPEDSGDYHGIISFWQGVNISALASFGPMNVAGTISWGIYRRTLGAFATVVGTKTPVVNTNYCLEAEIIRSTAGNADGAVRLYVDGVLEIEATGLDNDDRTLNYVIFGLYGADAPDLTDINVYGDCVVISDAYIGPEVSGDVLRRNLMGVGLQAKQHDFEKLRPKMPSWNPKSWSSHFPKMFQKVIKI